MTAGEWKDYEVLAAGAGEKLERWGETILLRPDPQVIWEAPFDLRKYKGLNAFYNRSANGGGGWTVLKKHPPEWQIGYKDLKFLIKPMGFKHTGLFPEQAINWDIMRGLIKNAGREINVLNLFGYTGGATVACAKEGAKVTHVDAAKAMVERCGQNAQLSGVKSDRIRYIVDDCVKFVGREIKRGKKYNAVIMDPPSYGRGPDGETWKIEDSLYGLVKLTSQIMDEPLFFLINSYTTGLQPTVINDIIKLALNVKKGAVEAYELCLPIREGGLLLPCGCSGIWKA